MTDSLMHNGENFTLDELRVLQKAGALQIGQKNDPAATTLTGQALHGYFQGNPSQSGLLTYPGVRPDRFSARPGTMSILRTFGLTRSEYTDNLLGIMTGQTAPQSTTNATGWCGNPPTVGQLKTCEQVFKFGKYLIKTNLNAIPEIGKLRSRADIPGRIINEAARDNPLIPDVAQALTDTRSVMATEMYTIGNQMAIDTEKVLWNGTYTGATQNNYAGWMNEFKGLSSQITTGYRDNATNLLCPAADSIVESFSAAIDGTDSLGRDIVEAITDHYFALKMRAKRVGMDGTVFAIAMAPEQFRAIVDAWACVYATYRCQSSNAGEPVTRDGMAIQALRVEMFQGEYLLIDGERVPVLLSDGITVERVANNLYLADIFILPISWNGRRLITIEYFPENNQYATEYANNFGVTTVGFMNNGLWVVGNRHTGLCLEWLFGAQMRVILETPFLASRLDDVRFSYFAQTRRADPAYTSWYANGGRSYTPVPSGY